MEDVTVQGRILLIDDNQPVLYALSLMAKISGYEAVCYEHASNALAHLQHDRQFDAVVSDIRMHPIGGFELLSTIRALYPDLPVVLMSGHADAKERLKIRALGGTACLQKPFTREDLRNAIGEGRGSEFFEDSLRA